MKFVDSEQLKRLLWSQFEEDAVVEINTANPQPVVTVQPHLITHICQFVSEYPTLFMDTLTLISGVDEGPANGLISVYYHLYSITTEKAICLRVQANRDNPEVPSVASVWRTADWHEREAYDLLGIRFLNHPDLRRILLPADWQGHPLRKDYIEAPDYHGISTTE